MVRVLILKPDRGPLTQSRRICVTRQLCSLSPLYSHAESNPAAHITPHAGVKASRCWGCQGLARKGSLGTHCKGGFHRLAPEVGTLDRVASAGCLCCTVSGRRLPWLQRTDPEGHVVETWGKERWLSLPVQFSMSFPGSWHHYHFFPQALCFPEQRYHSSIFPPHPVLVLPGNQEDVFAIFSAVRFYCGSGLRLTRCGQACCKPRTMVGPPFPLFGQQQRRRHHRSKAITQRCWIPVLASIGKPSREFYQLHIRLHMGDIKPLLWRSPCLSITVASLIICLCVHICVRVCACACTRTKVAGR